MEEQVALAVLFKGYVSSLLLHAFLSLSATWPLGDELAFSRLRCSTWHISIAAGQSKHGLNPRAKIFPSCLSSVSCLSNGNLTNTEKNTKTQLDDLVLVTVVICLFTFPPCLCHRNLTYKDHNIDLGLLLDLSNKE